VSSQIYDWTGTLNQILTRIQSGKLGGASYTLTLKNGGEKIQFNPGFTLPATVKAAAQKAITGIENGSIKVPQ
jgi:basic membrane lipoprotein Med (substrate-binding protein (PBP1-ABC) superfamily)